MALFKCANFTLFFSLTVEILFRTQSQE